MARRSKYKFATLIIGEEFKVDGIDVYSMKNSLVQYNERNEPIQIQQLGDSPDTKGRIAFKRIA